MRRVLAACVLAVALLAAACGSTQRAPARPAAVTAPSTPSPTRPAATVSQYASILNGPIKDAQQAWDDYQNNCGLDGTDLACTLGPMNIGLSAQNLGLTIDNIEVNHGPQDTDFLGSPPAEIAQLVESTRTAANKLAEDLKNPDKPGQGWGFDALTLASTLDRWGPYLG